MNFKLQRLLITIVLSVPCVAIAASDTVGSAVAVLGSVSVVRAIDGNEEALQMNSDLFLNDKVVTGADGLVKLLLRDESILKVSPNSELAISSMIVGPGEDGQSTVDLLKGRLRSVIGNSLGANTKFDVATSVAVAGVRGTDFEVVHVIVDGQWVTGVRVYDGSVEFEGRRDQAGGVIILPKQYSLANETDGPSPSSEIEADQSLLDILGIESSEFDEMMSSGEGFGDGLDVEQIQSVLLGLNTDININIVGILERALPTQTIRTKQPVETNDNDDVQLDIITDPLSSGATLSFDIEIPLPNE